MPWNGLGQRLANRNDVTQKPITTGMSSMPRFKAAEVGSGIEHTIWAKDLEEAIKYALERNWIILRENTDETSITTHKPGLVRSTPF